MLHARALDIASRLERRAASLGGDRLDGGVLDAQAANLIRDMVKDQYSRRSMIDETVRRIRNGMVEVKPEELQIIRGGLNQVRRALALIPPSGSDSRAALIAAEFLVSDALYCVEKRDSSWVQKEKPE